MDIDHGMGKVCLYVVTDKIGQIAILTQFNTNTERGINKASCGYKYLNKTNNFERGNRETCCIRGVIF
jgi:hypothetical protein